VGSRLADRLVATNESPPDNIGVNFSGQLVEIVLLAHLL
jgi:hypothetical protein